MKHALSISKVIERALLVDDTDGGLLSANPDALYVIGGLAKSLELVIDSMSRLNSSLGVEFGRVGNLEENILHDIRTKWPLEFERPALWFAIPSVQPGSYRGGTNLE